MPRTARSRRLALAVAASVIGTTALGSTLAAAGPTCPDEETRALCGGRIVAEPLQTTTFVQFDGDADGGPDLGDVDDVGEILAAIERLAPDLVEVGTLETWLGSTGFASAGGLPVYVVRVTDESVPRDAKKQVAISLSVHGTEPAGREGGLRYLEDLATQWAAGPADATLAAGDNAFGLDEVMAETESWFFFGNPDGWSAGDLDTATGGTFQRGNDHGADLNRDFATVGWFDRSGGRGLAESEPEIAGWSQLLRSFPDLATAVDIHGEITSVNDAFSDLIYSAGQWDPAKQAQVATFAKDMIATVEREFDEAGVVLADLFGPTIGQNPANVATAYDVVGYDDSGFMGDYMGSLNGNRTIEIDVENFLSHMVPGNAWVPALEQAHVAAVYGNIEATIVGAMYLRDVGPQVPALGTVGYVFDPAVTTDADGGIDVAEGEEQVPYSVTRMRYFEDLAEATDGTVVPVLADDVATTDLSAFDSIVVADLEALPEGATVALPDYVDALAAFARAGGQLVLTDASVQLVDELGLVGADDVSLVRTNAGHADFDPDQDDAWKAGLFGLPSQTYYEVPLGWAPEDEAPHHVVDAAAWDALDGSVTVGTVEGDVVLGRVPLGQGQVSIFGAILPQATEVDSQGRVVPHPHGLADYAVTIAGGTVLSNVLAYQRASAPVVPELPVSPAVALLGALAVAGILVRRRRA